MNDYALTLNGARVWARADGTLWWPEHKLLCVSDLHLGKSERIARRGGTLLPPYETAETLWRLETAVSATDPRRVICLGDSFDDLDAARGVSQDARNVLTRLQAGRDWVWIEGNHDPGPVDVGGSHRAEIKTGPLTFRHITDWSTEGEVSGHFHPKAAIAGAGRRACFIVSPRQVILPAFGAYTGGLSVRDPAFAPMDGPENLAVLVGRRAVAVPLSACLTR